MKKAEFLKEVRSVSSDELATRVRSNSEEQMKLRFRKASGQLQNADQIRQLRRQRARMLTIKKESALKQEVNVAE
jgi:large subunit ribosomal protein L29